MNRRDSIFALLALGASSVPFASFAQPAKKQWRVGVVWGGTSVTSKRYAEAFLAGMKDHGYEVGRNLIVDMRYAEGDALRIPRLVGEVIALKPDVLLGSTAAASISMKSSTSSIPIVMGTTSDPVGSGLAQSLSRPGGNLTGVALQLHELSAKHIEILAEMLPGMRRLALLNDSTQLKSLNEKFEQLALKAAAAKGFSVEVHSSEGPQEIRQVFRRLETHRPDALLVNPSPGLNAQRREICLNAARIGLPSIGFTNEWTEDGALLSYGPNFAAAVRRTAYFVDRIFKGARPADLPIEQPTKFDLVVNAKVAKALGIKIPGPVLLRADRVIE